MKRVLFSLISATFLMAEPSAFEAGNLDSPNPYGLTKDEKYILENKKNIQKLQKIVLSQQAIINQNKKTINNLKLKIVDLKLKLNLLSQKIDGINTVLSSIDDLNQKVNILKSESSNLKQEINSTNVIVFNLKDNFNQLQNIVNENKKTTDANINTVIGLTENIAKNIDSLNQQINLIKKKVDFTTWSKKTIFNKAISYFNSKNYAKAQQMFDYLFKNNYKPAASLFYLGEIEYKLGNYKNALAFYKKSIQKYSKKTKYMAELLYHTGYSFERLSKPNIAKKTYLKLIKDYPKSIFVKYAKKRLNNLEKTK